MNNLYGNEMIKKLAYNNYWFLPNPRAFNYMSVNLNGDIVYILEVDITRRPQRFFSGSEKIKVCPNVRSAYSANLHAKLMPNSSPATTKLSQNFLPKKNYIVHIANFQFYVRNGSLLDMVVHCVLAFHQRAWLVPFIHLNTKMRKHARNKLEQDWLKLLNNNCFGK